MLPLLEIGILLLLNLDMMLFLEYPDLDMFFLEIFSLLWPTRGLGQFPASTP